MMMIDLHETSENLDYLSEYGKQDPSATGVEDIYRLLCGMQTPGGSSEGRDSGWRGFRTGDEL